MTTNPETIELKLTTTNFYTRYPCTVCGDATEKVNVLCEGHDPGCEGLGADGLVRACERCLQEGDLDGRLEDHAERLELLAAGLRALIGRLKAPTYEQWQAQEERVDVANMACRHIRERFGRPSADHEYDAVMSDDAVYAKWQKQLQQEEDDYNDRLEQERQRRSAMGIVDTDEECPF